MIASSAVRELDNTEHPELVQHEVSMTMSLPSISLTISSGWNPLELHSAYQPSQLRRSSAKNYPRLISMEGGVLLVVRNSNNSLSLHGTLVLEEAGKM